MKSFSFNMSHVRVAGAAAVLAVSASAAQAQSAPFAGFAGSWSGSGTISLADGSNERIRCRADYAVDGGGSSLRQTLRCASDSYRFDLASNVRSQGGRVFGTWSETSRGVNGNLQGTAGAGRIEVVAEAPGYAANISMTTRGRRQSVAISSQGEIRGVNVNMVKS